MRTSRALHAVRGPLTAGLVPAFLLATACDDDSSDNLVCTTEAIPAILVEVRDAQTGEPAAELAAGSVSAPGFEQDLHRTDPLHLAGAYERPGTYRVRITASGYLPLEFDQVRARPGVCHVQGALLRADLELDVHPDWVLQLVEGAQSSTDPPQLIARYAYQGEIVYHVVAPCCDRLDDLYDRPGTLLCHPTGGFGGHGDGQCPDFLLERWDEVILWER
jgi:hypothetical protein